MFDIKIVIIRKDNADNDQEKMVVEKVDIDESMLIFYIKNILNFFGLKIEKN